jgi:hypothetical protein
VAFGDGGFISLFRRGLLGIRCKYWLLLKVRASRAQCTSSPMLGSQHLLQVWPDPAFACRLSRHISGGTLVRAASGSC